MDRAILNFFESLGDVGTLLLIFLEITLAALFSGFIGYERQYHGHAAGLRTHILVSIGACLIMIISIMAPGFDGNTTRDPARLAAQVVSGIGFLGAGTIIQTGTDIKGLTTAATIWLVGGIGLACGSGFFSGAIITTIVSILTLIFLTKIENILSKHFPKIIFTVSGDKPILKETLIFANKYGIIIKNVGSTIIKGQLGDLLRITITMAETDKSTLQAFADDIRISIAPHEIKVISK